MPAWTWPRVGVCLLVLGLVLDWLPQQAHRGSGVDDGDSTSTASTINSSISKVRKGKTGLPFKGGGGGRPENR